MANANVNMSVTGVSQFKRDMQTAQSSVKTLDSELKLAEAQYKATGDKETYMREKSELLKKKLDEQKKVVDNAQKALDVMRANGVDPASKSFQDMKNKLVNAKTSMLETKTQLEGIGTAGEEAKDGADNAQKSLQNIGKQVSFETVINGIGKITSAMEAAAKKAFELGQAMVRNTLGAGAWADELVTTATQYEITPEELQRIRKTADLIDTNAEAIIKARQRLMRGVGNGTKATMEALDALGVEYTGDAEKAFWDAGAAIMALGDEADREAKANALFGKSWHDLLPMFKAGREEYERTMEAQSVVSDDAIDRLGKMDDQYQKLQNELETVKMEFLSELAPAATGVMETLTGLVGEFNEYLQSENGQAMMQSLSDAVTGLFSDISKIDPQSVMEGLTGVINGITDAFKWLAENTETVKAALISIVGAWGALKLTGGALQLLQLINGIKGLGNGSIKMPDFGNGGGGDAAGGAGKTAGGGFLGKLAAKAGTEFSLMGGAGTFLPIAALGAAGFAGAKMIEANLNDENLNAIYGKNGGNGDIVETMGEQATKAAAAYWRVYSDEMKAGSEEAFNARDALFAALDEQGYENAEQGVSLIENIFDQAMNETDVDGLVAKMRALHAEIFGESESAGADAGVELANGVNGQSQTVYDASEGTGENVSVGFADGIRARQAEAIAAAQALADAVAATLTGALDIHSPSKVMMRIGEFASEGFAQGIESGYGGIMRAVDGMSRAAQSVPVRREEGSAGARVIDVTLMLGPDKLTEVLVPLVDSGIGQEIELMRR